MKRNKLATARANKRARIASIAQSTGKAFDTRRIVQRRRDGTIDLIDLDTHGVRLWADANAPRVAVLQFTLPSAGKELTSSHRSAQPTGEPHEDAVSDAAHQTAYEGS